MKITLLGKESSPKTIIYNGNSLQNEDGTVLFANPIPFHVLTSFTDIILEYTVDLTINKVVLYNLDKYIYPVLICGIISPLLKELPIPTHLPILPQNDVYFDLIPSEKCYKLRNYSL